jgi:glutamate-ammonia-ligase adenylyltransferase
LETPLFQLSPFIQKQFSQFPALYKLLKLNNFNLKLDWQNYHYKNSHQNIFCLTRNYRKSRLALIAAREDVGKSDSYITTLKLTSQLASLLVQYTYQYCKIEFKQKYGEVIDSKGQSQELIIYALGKLGGNELNYSSDIDLVFCYTGNGVSNGIKQIDAYRYFERLGRRVIQILDSLTQDGFVYRVDMRLRPFGNSAPLVCTVDHLLSYLHNEGRDWERYAWLRASFIAGDQEVANQTLKAIQPFIYRKYLDYGVFESLRQIKEQIMRMQLNDPDNIKLGTGGIREIEFIIQTLQLTFAGRNRELQGNDLWHKLHLLNQFKHLSDKELPQLSKAWLFLRKLENLSQIIDDRPSHHLPSEHPLTATCMGYSNMDELMVHWNQHRQAVQEIFQSLFINNTDLTKKPNNHPKIRKLKDQITQQNHPKTTKHKIYSALDALSTFLSDYSEPQTQQIITRYFQVLQAICKRASYLSMLIESPYILKKLVRLLNIGQYFSDAISKHPILLELLFEEINDQDFDFSRQWNQFQKKHKILDSEDFIEILSQFKQRIQFLIITAYEEQNLTPQQACHHLSELAELILSLTIQQAWNDCNEKIEASVQTQQLIVIAYGSLAMKSMNLDSDFDIVFVFDSEITEDNHRFVMRWVKRIMHLLTTQSYSGYLYKLDTQLRPNGNSGATIVTANNFEDYQLNHAWVWEHAALIKTRTVYATEQQKLWFNEVRIKALCRPRNAETVHSELS